MSKVYNFLVEITFSMLGGGGSHLLARPPPGGRAGMPLSVDRFLITVTKSGNPSSPARDSISKTTPGMLLHKLVLTKGQNSRGKIGFEEEERTNDKSGERKMNSVQMEVLETEKGERC